MARKPKNLTQWKPESEVGSSANYEDMEVLYEPQLMNIFTYDSINVMNDRPDNITDEEKAILYKCIDQLTEHQRKIILLWLKGKNQQEIAGELKITQGAINHCLWGTHNYKNGVKGKRHGGALKKLRKLMLKEGFKERSTQELGEPV